ncbi:HPP family protein [Hirschia baltica]|uniref:CBS domain containing membrane protein n=1 Tax=Hirschia baltica (strain ATCC 49814 / DSM 5838 / IFAM 1418) TaxID=582402 RepID=C6XQK0_HIRBI|nr:HPP family protein [Hirschia baltica]ACT58606.1 CBS domain containing membrane protein [Hirschia baltica ATCC 49814]
MMLRILRSLGPAVTFPSMTEAIRAGFGAFVGLGLTGLFVLSPIIDLQTGLYLVAPFGATSVLLFAVPNSPLAQPWSAIVGNTIAAIVAIAICMFISDPTLSIAVSVGLAITATILCRAIHPPAGAVAMTVAMSPDAIARLGFWFALTPIAIGTIALVIVAIIYAKLTGRHYPFRQYNEPNQHKTNDIEPIERLGLSEQELTDILERYSQSFNLGVEDLARLIGAAELQAAAHRTGPLIADNIMSRNLVKVPPTMPLSDVADLFRRHKFTALPVVDSEGIFLGVIFQIHLINRAREDSLRLHRGFEQVLKRLLDPKREQPIRAEDIMSVTIPRAFISTPIAALLPLMAEGDIEAIPIMDHKKIIGIVTRTDLIAALARTYSQSPPQP